MRQFANRTRLGRAITWLAVFALLLAPALHDIRFATCLGGPCCIEDAGAGPSGADASLAARAETERAAPQRAERVQHAATDAEPCCCKVESTDHEPPATPERPSDDRATAAPCAPSCCLEFEMDVDLGPSTPAEVRSEFEIDGPSDGGFDLQGPMPAFPVLATMPPCVHPRACAPPPPRPDRRTALRACTVLLI
jgi:hypothetical protein